MSCASPIQSSFPIELIEEILDYFDYLPDKDIQRILDCPSEGYKCGRVAVLTSCSLVSRAWLPRSRYHLFGSVRLSPKNHARFLPLVTSPLCSFLNSVRELVLTEEDREETIDYNDPEGDYWIHRVLPNFALSIFPRIRLLTITAARFDYMSKGNFSKMLNHLSGPTTITHLAIRHCMFRKQDQLIQALSSVKSSDCVCLQSPTLRVIPERDDKTQSQILTPTLSPSFSSLMINIDSTQSIVWMARIIPVAGVSLKRLSITLRPDLAATWDYCMDDFYNALNFDRHPNLKTIAFDSLSLGTRADGLEGRMKTSHVPAILRKITTSSIRQVILTLTDTSSSLKDLDDLNSVDWASISEVLSQENYSKLEEVTILGVNSHLIDEAMDIIMDGMKELLEKNLSVNLVLSSSRGPVMIPLLGG
ncbi:uncharacterized protein ARMOST_18272 [Armillaria ostoyae]|uniref:F-box domain-containing protein n=1 Tax=Armillaria ostoyae TaxID=47428 RepID=A0A284S1A9_ARMOS|nr:uncharacterized protein ARMOST_18272 [Armillaria ostoyae]